MATFDDTQGKQHTTFQFWRYRLGGIVRSHNRWARLAGDAGVVTLDEFLDIAGRQQWRCVYCNADLKSLGASLDHKTARSRGGLHQAENVQALCVSCNTKKQSKTDAEFREYRRLMYAPPAV